MPAPAATDQSPVQLLDRDLSWLEFNRRVLEEAQDSTVPLLERLKFLLGLPKGPDLKGLRTLLGAFGVALHGSLLAGVVVRAGANPHRPRRPHLAPRHEGVQAAL